jgi:hypothetical protein
MSRSTLRHLGTAVVLLVALFCQETWALAGTTGGLTGTVLDADTSAPIAGAQVTASSPSQTASGVTDAHGHFAFLTLEPDTYTVTVYKAGYEPTSAPGQIVFADTVQTVAVRVPKALKTIAHVAATAPGALVKSGTTADVYSINATTQSAVSALGGGGSLNSAYSAIATVPGAYVIPNQTGYYETVNIRGGDYDQVGYEFDGVPVNRAFDNYASSSASSLGNAEVQVYTGADPANSVGEGLAGYINQVIKSGTYPGYATASLGVGSPAFYHRAAIEVGGSTPDRNFSYYLGIAGANQSFNYINNQNGAGYDNWLGPPLGMIGGPSGQPFAPGWSFYFGGTGNTLFPMGPVQWGNFSWIAARNVVANFHIGIPHRYDAGRDDIQILYDNEMLQNQFYISANDTASPQCLGVYALSGVACANYINGATASTLTGGTIPYGTSLPITYTNTLTWSCPSSVGHVFSATALNAMKNCVSEYGFPNGVDVGTYDNPNTLGYGARDNSYNNTAVVKLQYTHNMGSNAFFRVYGYTFYSDWFLAGAYSTSFCNFVCPVAPDYELNTHTRGVSAEFSDQLNEQNLLSVQGNYTTATVLRDNNEFTALSSFGNEAVVVNSKDPYGGYCYPTTGGTPVNCLANTLPLGVGFSVPSLSGACAIPGQPKYGSACSYMLAENGLNGEYGSVTPNFYGASITDQYRPTDKWLFNVGVRLDTYGYNGEQTITPPLGGSAEARAFWFAAYNLDNCVSNATGVPFPNPGTPGSLCPAGSHGAALINDSAQQFVYNMWQPRISGTYTVNPNNVIRFSYGRYTEAPDTAEVQYNTRQQDLADYLGQEFYQYGRNTPGYPIAPPASLNYDLSWESHLKGTDWSFKVTPFLRQTQDQIQSFFLNPIQGFVSGLNVGSQRSQGVEFQLQKGDFSRNGVSGLLSFAYTNTYIKYGTIAAGANGTTVISSINTGIAQYNAYTRACAHNPTNPNCGTTSNGLTANACYTPSGTPVAPSAGGLCPHGDIANPYWNSPIQSLISASQAFPTYDTFPTNDIGLVAQGFNAPYVGSLVLNYKHDKLAITPSFQFQGGSKYGVPITEAGIDPASGCGAPLVGERYNATTCPGTIDIPNPFTGVFDGIGAFTQPNEFMTNLQVSYDVSPSIQLVAVAANIVNYCWGGTKAPWTVNDGNICAYGNVSGTVYPVAPYGTPGAIVNPPGYSGSVIQSFRKYPYLPTFGPALVSAENFSTKMPLQLYFTANIKI